MCIETIVEKIIVFSAKFLTIQFFFNCTGQHGDLQNNKTKLEFSFVTSSFAGSKNQVEWLALIFLLNFRCSLPIQNIFVFSQNHAFSDLYSMFSLAN